jgi:histidinol-phosphate aminotransferase
MSKFASKKINDILPYTPGEQPQDKKYIKLNTNENPYYTANSAVETITGEMLKNLRKYSDPECKPLVKAIANFYGVNTNNVLVSNGSDEALAFCFQAYGKNGVCFADVTYGFYSVFANLYDCPVERIPLKQNFTIRTEDYLNKGKTVVIANPNAQTGIALKLSEIEKIIKNNLNNIVLIDQAYVDFGGENVIPLTKKYDNLVVVNTFSKSRSLAGARVGFVIANEKLIEDLNKIKYSFHPYNVNSISMALATKAIEDKFYFEECVRKVIKSRENLTEGLTKLGFEVLPSSANFVLAKNKKVSGEKLYEILKERGILVRHFNEERISDYVRITIGTDEEIKILLEELAKILEVKA